VAGVLVAALTSAPAFAQVDQPGPGVVCTLSAAVEDPTAEPGTITATLSGGPLTLTDSTTGLPGSGTLSCYVSINGSGWGPRVEGHGTGTVTAGPAQVSFHAEQGDVIAVCGEFTDDSDGTTYYWDGSTGAWTATPSSACTIPPPPVTPPPPPPTNTVAVADCPYGNVVGDILYSAPVQATPLTVSWTMTLHADCVGTSPLAGHYDLTLVGQSTESCTAGNGYATVVGTGPNGALTGSWSFTRGGIHYYGYVPSGYGSFTDATGPYQMAWWLDLFPNAASSCPIPSAHIVGHGALHG
jgi:hypothetical protein